MRSFYNEAMHYSLRIFTLLLLLLVLAVFLATRFVPGLQISSFAVIFNSISGAGSPETSHRIADSLVTAPNLQLTVFADNLTKPRILKTTPHGQLLVSSPPTGSIILLADTNGDGQADDNRVILSNLKRPHGIEIFDDGNTSWLYVAETNAVGRVAMDWTSGEPVGDYQRLITDLPPGGGHWTRSIRFGPDGLLYLTVGSSCNVCEESDPRRAAMMRYQADGSGEEIIATGLRNSVGFDWTPWSNQLYATDNGRDMLGDHFPPCELNLIQAGGFYGWPYINGFGKLDPDLGQGKEHLLTSSLSPSYGFPAHNAPLGIHFLHHSNRPETFQRTALVALHGSWNRSEPDGYKVVALRWDQQGTISSRDVLTGFLRQNQQVIGRPVDIEEGSDGSIYISDDYAGSIYRMLYID